LGKPRSLAKDTTDFVMSGLPAAPIVRGEDNIPERGPFIVVGNHYERPGLWMAWPALMTSEVIRRRTGQDVRWVAIEEWESFSVLGIQITSRMIRYVFERTFRTYGLLAMSPPTAPPNARAQSMRLAAHAIRSGEVIGIMPEGTVGATPELLEAREGVGAFLMFLSSPKAPLLPVGLYEEDGRLVVQFGEPLHQSLPSSLAKAERDHWMRDVVMLAIRNLIPGALWGAYRDVSRADS